MLVIVVKHVIERTTDNNMVHIALLVDHGAGFGKLYFESVMIYKGATGSLLVISCFTEPGDDLSCRPFYNKTKVS